MLLLTVGWAGGLWCVEHGPGGWEGDSTECQSWPGAGSTCWARLSWSGWDLQQVGTSGHAAASAHSPSCALPSALGCSGLC